MPTNNYDTNPRGQAIDPMNIALEAAEAAWAKLEQPSEVAPALVAEPVLVTPPVQATRPQAETTPPHDVGTDIFRQPAPSNQLVHVPPRVPEVRPGSGSSNGEGRALRIGSALLALTLIGIGAAGAVEKFSGNNDAAPTATAHKHPGAHNHPGKTQHNHDKVKIHHPTSESSASASPSTSPSAHPQKLTPNVLVGPTAAPTSEPTQEPTKGTTSVSEAGATLRVGTYNQHGASHTAERGPQSGPERAKRAAALIKKLDLDVIGVQEFQRPQRSPEKKALGKNYGMYPKHAQYGIHTRLVNSVNSIIWDKRKVTFESARSLAMRYFHGWKMRIPLVKFRANKTGQEFYVANTHDPAFKEWAKYRYLDAKMHAKAAKAIIASGLPLFFTGDFNSGYNLRHKRNITWGDKFKNMTRSIMARVGGMVDGYDAVKGRGVRSQKTKQELGTGIIDHVEVSPDIDVAKYNIVSKGTASDHKVVYIVARLPRTTTSKQ